MHTFYKVGVAASLKNATGKDDPTHPMASLSTKPHFLHLALNTTEC